MKIEKFQSKVRKLTDDDGNCEVFINALTRSQIALGNLASFEMMDEASPVDITRDVANLLFAITQMANDCGVDMEEVATRALATCGK